MGFFFIVHKYLICISSGHKLAVQVVVQIVSAVHGFKFLLEVENRKPHTELHVPTSAHEH